MLRQLAKAHDWLTHWSYVLAAVLLGVIFVEYCAEVVLRYLLNAPTSWGGELISYAQSASVFLVMPLLTQKGGHVAITIIVERLPPRAAGFLTWILYFVSFVICALGAWITWDESFRQYIEGVQLMKVHPIPQWWVSIFIGYGFAMSAIHFLRHLDFKHFSAKYAATSTIG
jgi:TRAP-type C4-dicarboxylate transport system permease small subunit